MGVPRIAAWYTDWCEPVVCALYRRNVDEIHEKMSEAYGALGSGELSTVDAECLSYQLTYLELQCQLVIRRKGWVDTRLPEVLRQMSEKGSTQKSERLRARLLLQMRITLDRLHVMDFSQEEFEELFEIIPEWEQTTEFWLYVSGWAFRKRLLSYVEQAYEYAVLQANGFHVEWVWQRVHMMVKLLRGSANRNDLLWLIDKVALPEQLMSLKFDIWPLAKELNVADEALELRLEERRLELEREKDGTVISMLKPHMNNPKAIASS